MTQSQPKKLNPGSTVTTTNHSNMETSFVHPKDTSPRDLPHDPACGLHLDSKAIICNGRTRAGNRCKYRATIYLVGFYPTCTIHKSQKTPAGKCQAIQTCGRACNLLTEPDPPFNLCGEHEKGTATLPCYLMALPTETRLEIFRYLLPKSIPSSLAHKVLLEERSIFSLLRINKQIGGEASLVLFGEALFKVNISPDLVQLCCQDCSRRSNRGIPADISFEDIILPITAKKIRNFAVNIDPFDENADYYRYGVCSLPRYNDKEDRLYRLRDSIQSFVEMARPTGTFHHALFSVQKLEVRLEIFPRRKLSPDETIAAAILAMEPLKDLGRVKEPKSPNKRPWDDRYESYNDVLEAYKSQWEIAISRSPIASRKERSSWQLQEEESKYEFRKIETFIHKLVDNELVSSWVDGAAATVPFCGMRLVTYLARVAREQHNLVGLKDIQNALKERLYQYQEARTQESRLFADIIQELFKPFETAHTTLPIVETDDGDANISTTEHPPSTTYNRYSPRWPEIDMEAILGTPQSKDLIVSEDRERRYYQDGDRRFCRLKTPGFVGDGPLVHFPQLTRRQVRAHRHENNG